MARRILLSILIFFLLIAALAHIFRPRSPSGLPLRTEKISRGDLLISISATGTIEPEEVIDVGAQVAGQIQSFGKDRDGKTVDYGSIVTKDMVLAMIDDSIYSAEAAKAEGEVKYAQATLRRAESDRLVAKAKFRQAERDWLRARGIGPSEALSQLSYDSYLGAYEIAKANLDVSEEAILQAKAGIHEAEAALLRAERNLGYCTITAPVDGIIIDRRVNIGQTVVASLNAPSLFLLAKDLRRMQVWVAVNEADISRIRPGQDATFTIDALPNETFTGKVGKIRLNASMTQNVVTYTVEVVTDNSHGRLLPYLTADVQFEINNRLGVLLVPNSALRWEPPIELINPLHRSEAGTNRPSLPLTRTSSSAPENQSTMEGQGTLWLLEESYVRPLHVQIGLTDGLVTEVSGEKLAENTVVVTGIESVRSEKQGPNNPFMPILPTPPGGAKGGTPR